MLLEELKWTELKSLTEHLFLVPLGSLEQHGPHLPLNTDTVIVSEIARRVEAQLSDKIALTPTQWVGHSPHHSHFGCISLDVRPYMDLIGGICRSLIEMGARKIFLLNGHGGNDIPCKAALRELKTEFRRHTGLHIGLASYWNLAAGSIAELRESPRGGLGHACEMETSIMLALAPERVSMKEAVDDGPFRQESRRILDMLHPQPYYLVREFHEISDSGTLGMPSFASAEKGERLLNAITDAVVNFVVEFSTWAPVRAHDS